MGGAGFFLIVIAFGFLYFVMVRPQKKRQVAQMRMLNELAVGDEVVTAGGIYGEIVGLGEEDVTVRIAPNLDVRVAPPAIGPAEPSPVVRPNVSEVQHSPTDGRERGGPSLSEGGAGRAPASALWEPSQARLVSIPRSTSKTSSAEDAECRIRRQDRLVVRADRDQKTGLAIPGGRGPGGRRRRDAGMSRR